ncbi:MAG TPA: acetylornithine transaminase [Bryobacteraceae bacterium]|nr:acetylornithine transaminase [Bryobacteraceae bacterium]
MTENPFLLRNYARLPLVADSGEGCYLTDTSGKRYLDAIAGIGVNALGYSHPRITAVIEEQARRLIHTSNLISNGYAGLLAEKLCGISGLNCAFFSNSGTEAMEAALKAVRAWSRSNGNRLRIVALHNSFHGRTCGSLAVTGQPAIRADFEPLAFDVTFVEPNDPEALGRAVRPDVAAVVLEPVLGEGGIYPLTIEFLRQARALTTDAGALLIADETQCGLGRTGKHFAFQWAEIAPDVVVTAKPLAAGIPIGATLFTEAVARYLPPHAHGSTFGGGPLACRVALEFLSILDELLPHICEIAAELRARLDCLKRCHSVIREIRAKGMMFGIELTRPGHDIVRAALDRGLLINCTHDTVLRLLPPYILTSAEAAELVRILEEVFTRAV